MYRKRYIKNLLTMEDATPRLYQLNTANKDALTFNTGEIGYTILGGINANHLDRMRVTLKIEVLNRKYPEFMQNETLAGIALRANVDLYHDVQVEKLIRRTADKLEIGTTQLYSSIAQLTEQLESYRLKLIEKEKDHKPKPKQLTEQEREEAITFLKQETLNNETSKLIAKAGIIGEETNRLIMWYVYTSRKLARPLHIISFGSSGTGKSHLQEKVAELIPEEDKIEITSLTQNAFYYFGTDELGHKLILIEDFDGALTALYPIRELQSKQRISKTLTIKDNKGNTKTIHLKVQGPVSVAGCTTQEQVYEDNANRSFLIYLDESKEQDEKVMHYQRLLAAGKVSMQQEHETKALLQNVQRVLKPVTIINPYAEYLAIPTEVFKPRRTNAHYLGFIEAVTFYHQYQREECINEDTGEVYIKVSIADIEIANSLIKEILLRKSDELNKATRTYFEFLKAWLKAENKTTFSTKEVRQALRTNSSNQKRYMLCLLSNGYVKKVKGKKATGFLYEVSSFAEYEELKQKVNSILDEIVVKLKEAKKNLSQQNNMNSSVVVHSKNEPPKATPVKRKRNGMPKVHPKQDIQP